MMNPANQPEPSLHEQIRLAIRSEMDSVYGNSTHNYTPSVAENIAVEKVMQLYQAHEEAAVREAKLNTEFMMASSLHIKMMPLMVHSKEPDFPSMTKEILDQIWLWSGESIANWQLTHPQAGEGEGK